MIPFCNVTQTLAWEQAAMQAGTSQRELMERAGTILFRELDGFSSQSALADGPFLFLVGPGNNGGDGLICAKKLLAKGHVVRIYVWRRSMAEDQICRNLSSLGDCAAVDSDFNYQLLRKWVADSRWVIDCLLGTGVNRPISGQLARLLAIVNEGLTQRHYVCAADCPSGVNCDNGNVDPSSLPANLTVMFGTAKRGLFRSPALEYSGRTVVGDIGLSSNGTCSVIGWGLEPKDLPGLMPFRPEQSHKGTFGKAFCIVGSRRYPGAAHLSARSAAVSGVGLVCAAVPKSVQSGLVANMSDVTFLPYKDSLGTVSPSALPETVDEALKYSAVLLGCGLSHTTQTVGFTDGFLAAWRNQANGSIPLVLDADALNCLASLENWPKLLPSKTILTPHMAEMGRLCDLAPTEVISQAPELALTKARDWGCTLVLKGPQTWIGTPEGDLFAILDPNSALATAGTGDVLAGQMVGLLAQCHDPVQAAKGATLVHSLAGQSCALEVGRAGTSALDVLARIPIVLRQNDPAGPKHLWVRHNSELNAGKEST